MAVGDKAGAVSAFRRSLRLDPKQADIARTLADVREDDRR
jgi:cytochrome c-type biogenesis protein CcmH/NrfG